MILTSSSESKYSESFRLSTRSGRLVVSKGETFPITLSILLDLPPKSFCFLGFLFPHFLLVPVAFDALSAKAGVWAEDLEVEGKV